MLRNLAFLSLVLASLASAEDVVSFRDLSRHELYKDIKISPDGEYIAATAVVKDKTVLSLVHLADMKGANLRPQDRDDVVNFWWVGSHRVVFSVTQRIFGLDGVFANGELYGINADGSNRSVIYSWRHTPGLGIAEVAGKLGDSGKLLVQATPEIRCDRDHGPYPTARALDEKGDMEVLATAPICGADFIADNRGVVRFAFATDEDQYFKLFYRDSASESWKLQYDEAKEKIRYIPLRFNRDDSQVYFTCPGKNGVGGICRWDVKTKGMSTLWSGTESAAEQLIDTFDERDAFAIASLPGRPALTLLDKGAVEAQMLATLYKEFPGQQVRLGDHSADGKKTIVYVSSDTNPGEFYLYDAGARKLTFLLASRPWIKPEQMAQQEPVQLKARDGASLHGYFSRPPNAAKRTAAYRSVHPWRPV